jgi:hypothetical protein
MEDTPWAHHGFRDLFCVSKCEGGGEGRDLQAKANRTKATMPSSRQKIYKTKCLWLLFATQLFTHGQ